MTGADVRRWRKRRGWSQQQLADALSVAARDPVHWTTVSRWERGELPVPALLPLALDGLDAREHSGALHSPATESPA